MSEAFKKACEEADKLADEIEALLDSSVREGTTVTMALCRVLASNIASAPDRMRRQMLYAAIKDIVQYVELSENEGSSGTGSVLQ